jgi:hypothetical protein
LSRKSLFDVFCVLSLRTTGGFETFEPAHAESVKKLTIASLRSMLMLRQKTAVSSGTNAGMRANWPESQMISAA